MTTEEQLAQARNEIDALRRENGDLQGKLTVAEGKERELRALISYLNKLGPKPENMAP